MIKKNLEWLPLVCDKVIRQEYCSQHLLRTARDCSAELTLLKGMRYEVHCHWLKKHMARELYESAIKTIEWSDTEIQHLDSALHHVQEWERASRHADLIQVRTRLQMADQAHKQYLKNRIALEPFLPPDLAQAA